VKVGNVRETPFPEIWANSPIFHELRTAELKGNCGSCDHQDICGGCRARAYYYSDGDYMAGGAVVRLRPAERRLAAVD